MSCSSPPLGGRTRGFGLVVEPVFVAEGSHPDRAPRALPGPNNAAGLGRQRNLSLEREG